MQYLGDRAFKAQVEAGDLDTPKGVGVAQSALGFGASKVQASAHLKHVNVSDIVGLYVPPHTALIKGGALNIEHTDILVHELTHAWDDGALPASDRQTRSAPADKYNAETALREGDAAAVQADYLDSIGPEQGCQVMEELVIPFTSACRTLHYSDALGQINPGDIDSATEAYTRFPYTIGVWFVRALRAHGGEQEVDRAFAHPPVDTAQVIEPSLYFHHDAPRRVPAPTVLHQIGRPGSLGDLGVSATLTGGAFNLSRHGYLRGWAGDTYVDSLDGKHECLHDDLALRSPSYAASALRRFHRWVAGGTGRSASRIGPDTLTFTVCH